MPGAARTFFRGFHCPGDELFYFLDFQKARNVVLLSRSRPCSLFFAVRGPRNTLFIVYEQMSSASLNCGFNGLDPPSTLLQQLPVGSFAPSASKANLGIVFPSGTPRSPLLLTSIEEDEYQSPPL